MLPGVFRGRWRKVWTSKPSPAVWREVGGNGRWLPLLLEARVLGSWGSYGHSGNIS
jgi:hypothetical protein